jgi:hypothetical protein
VGMMRLQFLKTLIKLPFLFLHLRVKLLVAGWIGLHLVWVLPSTFFNLKAVVGGHIMKSAIISRLHWSFRCFKVCKPPFKFLLVFFNLLCYSVNVILVVLQLLLLLLLNNLPLIFVFLSEKVDISHKLISLLYRQEVLLIKMDRSYIFSVLS